MREFREFLAEARKRGFNIKADIILNHISDEHEWFKAVLDGDEEKLNYFVSETEIPKHTRYRDENVGIVVKYEHDNGLVSKRRLIFPEIAEHHYRRVNINGEDRYFYHTFYPFQLDINWENPEVLYYMLDVLSFWANIGVDIFRLDAIPYLFKEEGTSAENLDKTHEVIKLASAFMQAISPRSALQAEACMWPEDILPYFGDERTIKQNVLYNKAKELTRTDEVQIAYHFPYMPAIWASMVTNDNSHFWKAHEITPEIPETTAWAVFLRVHDELTLEMVDPETRAIIYDNLVENGAEFREGFGVSGRMANFLENNPDRIGLAFSILLSMPGVPIIYYGDEIGAQNNWRYAKASEEYRKEMAKNREADLARGFFDSRDINRGPITKDTFYKAMNDEESFSGKIHKIVRNLIHLRNDNDVIRRGDFTKLETSHNEIFTYLRTYDSDEVIVINNLSGDDVVSDIKVPANTAAKIEKAGFLTNLIADEEVNVEKISSDTYRFSLQPYQAMWISLK